MIYSLNRHFIIFFILFSTIFYCIIAYFMEAVKALAGTDPQASWTFICDGLNTHKSESLVRFVAEACAHQRPLTGGGDMSFFTVFVIMALNMILAFVLLFASVKINCMNIRNAAKMELNNVSARIYADTFHA